MPFKLDDILDSISTFFKPEKDPFFKLGKELGESKKGHEFVANFIDKFGFNDQQAADAANVSVEFVEEVRRSLNR